MTYVAKYKSKQYIGVDLTKCQKIPHSLSSDMKGFDHVLALGMAPGLMHLFPATAHFLLSKYSKVIMNSFRFVMAIKNSLLRTICFVIQFSVHQEWLILTAIFLFVLHFIIFITVFEW